MKLECIENPGSQATSAVRECDASPNIPFGLVEVPEESEWRVYHVPTGQWVWRGTEVSCARYLHELEGVSADQPVDWGFEKPVEMRQIHRDLLEFAKKSTKN